MLSTASLTLRVIDRQHGVDQHVGQLVERDVHAVALVASVALTLRRHLGHGVLARALACLDVGGADVGRLRESLDLRQLGVRECHAYGGERRQHRQTDEEQRAAHAPDQAALLAVTVATPTAAARATWARAVRATAVESAASARPTTSATTAASTTAVGWAARTVGTAVSSGTPVTPPRLAGAAAGPLRTPVARLCRSATRAGPWTGGAGPAAGSGTAGWRTERTGGPLRARGPGRTGPGQVGLGAQATAAVLLRPGRGAGGRGGRGARGGRAAPPPGGARHPPPPAP